MEKYLIGIVGSRNTGKTTSTINLVNIFSTNGYEVGIIKFSSHKFDIDPSHKDSALLRNTKADVIISSTPHETVIYQRKRQREDLNSLIKRIPEEVNIVFCESYPSDFPILPLIFVCDDVHDYYETKKRFGKQKPLFITGIISNQSILKLEHNLILSNKNPTHLEKAKQIILKNWESMVKSGEGN
jgi:molybdopterin-guanine dinucleotide biosynthesis protein MobB